jgi:hypothetical protein
MPPGIMRGEGVVKNKMFDKIGVGVNKSVPEKRWFRTGNSRRNM